MTNDNNNDKGMGVAGGLIIGILLTLVVGLGTCYLMFNPIHFGSNDSYEPEYSQTEISSLQQLNDKANQAAPDPEASWLMSLVIVDSEARKLLKKDMTDEQAQIDAEKYYQQALNAQFPAAVVKQSYELINKGLDWTQAPADPDSPDERPYAYISQAQIKDAKSVEQGVSQINKVLKIQCETLYNEDNDLQYVLGAYPTLIPLYFNDLSQLSVQPYPSLYDAMDIASLRQAIHCQYPDEAKRKLVQLLVDDEVYTNEWHTPARQLVYLSVLAELLDKPDIVYLINRRAPVEAQDDFSKQRSALLSAYTTAFGDQIPVDAIETDE